MDKLPDRLGRYRVESIIGKGAMGTVYRGYDPKIDRTVALKTFNVNAFEEEDQKLLVQRFHQEAQLAGRLSHPNIVTIFDVGDDYIAMEFLEGISLQDELKKRTLTVDDVIRIVAETAAALDHAHRNQIIHRDIKPANILLVGAQRTAKLTDFGIAKTIDGTMTATGLVLGTPFYMSPEQVMGKRVDYRSDLFALAVVAYEMLSGSPPFQGDTITTVAYKIVNDAPPPISRMQGSLPAQIDAVLSKALAKEPEQRFSTAAEFARALSDAMLDRPSTQPLPTVMAPHQNTTVLLNQTEQPLTAKTKTRWGWFIAAPLLVLLIAAGLAWIFSQDRPQREVPRTAVEPLSTAENDEPTEMVQPSAEQPLEDPETEVPVPASSGLTDPPPNLKTEAAAPKNTAVVDTKVKDRSSDRSPEPSHAEIEVATPANDPVVATATNRQPSSTVKKPMPPKPATEFAEVVIVDVGKAQNLIWNGDRLYVADRGSESVKIFAKQARDEIATIDLPDEPGSIWVDSAGRILVPDPGDNLIRRYTPSGELDESFADQGELKADFDGPRAVITDSQGNLWVADTDNHRVVKVNQSGALLVELEGFKKPVALLFGPKGNLVVLDLAKNRVTCLSPAGKEWWVLGEEGSGKGQFDEPQGLAMADGFLYVADTGNHRIQIFDFVTRAWVAEIASDEGPSRIRSPKAITLSQGAMYLVSNSGDVLKFIGPAPRNR